MILIVTCGFGQKVNFDYSIDTVSTHQLKGPMLRKEGYSSHVRFYRINDDSYMKISEWTFVVVRNIAKSQYLEKDYLGDIYVVAGKDGKEYLLTLLFYKSNLHSVGMTRNNLLTIFHIKDDTDKRTDRSIHSLLLKSNVLERAHIRETGTVVGG